MSETMTTREAADLMGVTCSAVSSRMAGMGIAHVGRVKLPGRGAPQLLWRRADVMRVHDEYTRGAPAGWWSAREIMVAAYVDRAVVNRTLRRGARVMVSRVTGRRCRHWTTRTIKKHLGVDMREETR